MKEKNTELEKDNQKENYETEEKLKKQADLKKDELIDDEILEYDETKDDKFKPIEYESIDDIKLLDEISMTKEDKYIKLTPRRFYMSIIIAPILVFFTLIALIFGGNYLYREIQINKQVDEMIQNALDSTTNGVSVNSTLKEGMIALIDYDGSIDGEEFDGSSGEDYSLVIGSGTFIDGFEDQLIGHKKGDKINVKVTFPEDYSSEDLAGKEAIFKVTINDVQEAVENKLNNDFVESLGISDVTTVEQLKDYLRDYIKSQSSTSSY